MNFPVDKSFRTVSGNETCMWHESLGQLNGTPIERNNHRLNEGIFTALQFCRYDHAVIICKRNQANIKGFIVNGRETQAISRI